MNFGQALEALKAGKKVSRSGWNGKGMYLRMSKGGISYLVVGGGEPAEGVGTEPHLLMWTAQQNWVPWLASQTDVLAEDWGEVPA